MNTYECRHTLIKIVGTREENMVRNGWELQQVLHWVHTNIGMVKMWWFFSHFQKFKKNTKYGQKSFKSGITIDIDLMYIFEFYHRVC